MAQLHRELRKRLRAWLDSLPVKIAASRFEDRYNREFDSFCKLLLQTPPWREYLEVSDVIQLAEWPDRFEDRIPQLFKGRLADVPVSGLVDAIEADFAAFLESIPRDYFVYIQLPRISQYKVPYQRLATGVSLVQTVDSFKEHPMLPRGAEPIPDVLRERPIRLIRDTTYIRFDVLGYAGWSLQSYAVARAIGRLKHFLFMALTETALRKRSLADYLYEFEYRGQASDIHAAVFSTANPDTDAFQILLPDELIRFLRWIRINEEGLRVRDEKGKVLIDSPPAETGEEKVRAFASRLHLTSRFLDLKPDDDDAERIRAAMEWWVDAEAVDNHTVAFLQACIGLEALLGDADDRGRIKDKLSDRYSYLLGRTLTERQDLKNKFIAMYDHRSTLVHGRRARLSQADLNAMVESRRMLVASIDAEVRNLLEKRREREEASDQ